MALLMLILSLLVFTLLWLSPGSVLATLIGTRPVTPQIIAALTAEYHLKDPFIVQYWHWLVHAVHFDFGRSIQYSAPVTSLITQRLPITATLAGYTLFLTVVFGVPAGMIAAIRRGGVIDRTISTLTVLGMSAPSFAIGLVLLYVFGVRLGWFPVYGAGIGFVDRIYHLTMPAVAFATFLTAIVARQTRAAALNVVQQDYITFARARGLSPTRVLVRYALRNTALPVVTVVGLLLIVALSGALFIEQVFSLSGVGALMYQSVNLRDIPVVQGLAFFASLFVISINLAVDLVALVIDPRTRYETRADR